MKRDIVIYAIFISVIIFVSLIVVNSNLVSVSYDPGDEVNVTFTITTPGDNGCGSDEGDSGGGSSGGGSGGGGSSGGGSGLCTELWSCSFWNECVNVEDAFSLGLLSEEDYMNAQESCVFEGYSEETCGYQTRVCEDSNGCNNGVFSNPKPLSFQACHFITNPGCSDGIANCHDGSCELGIDCGGPCSNSCEVEEPTDAPLSLFSKILIFLGFKLPITFADIVIVGIITSGLSMVFLILYFILISFTIRMAFGRIPFSKKKFLKK